jgi:hypothetical protein
MYRLVTLYEAEYYKQFIVSDLDSLLKKAGVEVIETVSILFGAGRILKGIRKA